MDFKSITNAIAIILTVVCFYPYVRDIITRGVVPHPFSWIIWGITTSISFVAQLSAGGGIGAYSIGLSALLCFGIFWLSLVRTNALTLYKSDWLFLILSILALALWLLTDSALWAAVVSTGIDLLGFLPTITKVHRNPHSENSTFYLLFALRNGFSIAALEAYNATTLVFPVGVSAGCIVLVAYIFWRRTALSSLNPGVAKSVSNATVKEV